MCFLLTDAILSYCSLNTNIATFTGQPKEELFAVRTGMTVATVGTIIVSSCTNAIISLDRLFAVSPSPQYNTSFHRKSWSGGSISNWGCFFCVVIFMRRFLLSFWLWYTGKHTVLAQQSSTKLGWWESGKSTWFSGEENAKRCPQFFWFLSRFASVHCTEHSDPGF